MEKKHNVPFDSAMDEAEAIDAKVAAIRLNLQMDHGLSTRERAALCELICDAQKMALRLRAAVKP